jgi:hypothetical protein
MLRSAHSVCVFCVGLRTNSDFFPYTALTVLFSDAFAKFRKALASLCLSVRPSVRLSAWSNSSPTGRIFIKFDIWVFFENLSRKFKFHENVTRIKGTWHEAEYIFLIISRSILLRMRNVSDKHCRESQNTHFVFSNFFRKPCRLRDNVQKYCRAGQATDDNMTHAHGTLDT